MFSRTILIAMIFTGSAGLTTIQAEERIDLEKDNIIGNEESPKALYVVPWRPLQPVGVAGLEIQSLLDEELELINPESFKRQVELFELKQAAKAKAK